MYIGTRRKTRYTIYRRKVEKNMWIADGWKDYEVLDTSKGEKLERWGKYLLVRPDPQVIWNTKRVNKVEDVVSEGDEIMVKLVEIDKMGRNNLSRKDALADIAAKKAAADAE